MRPALIASALAAALLGGCGASVQLVPTTVVTPGMPNPEEALRQSMQHVDAEMAELGQYAPTPVVSSMPVIPADLQRVVSFKWAGPLDRGVAKLAQSVGYTFYVTAPPEAQPYLVSVEVDHASDRRCVLRRSLGNRHPSMVRRGMGCEAVSGRQFGDDHLPAAG